MYFVSTFSHPQYINLNIISAILQETDARNRARSSADSNARCSMNLMAEKNACLFAVMVYAKATKSVTMATKFLRMVAAPLAPWKTRETSAGTSIPPKRNIVHASSFTPLRCTALAFTHTIGILVPCSSCHVFAL